MADWSSLINSPPPTNFPTICECEGHILASNDIRGRSKVIEVSAHLPQVDTNLQDPKIGHKLQADSTFLSAKQAFLEAEETSPKSAILKAKPNLFRYFEHWLTVNEEKWWFRFISSFNIFGFFKSSLKMKVEEFLNIYTTTRNFTNSPVKCLAWHPHISKIAVAMKDDGIQICLKEASITPLLKHKKQKLVACMAWRPFSASELAVGCASGILIWTVDPLSVVARPSAACVSFLSEDLKYHQPVTSLSWNPQGTLLLSSSAADNTMYVWNTASELKVPVKRISGGGIHLAKWSPVGSAVMSATTSTVFRIWNTSNWLPERWNVLSGHINSFCWSPCGTAILFTTSEDTQIYCLRFVLNEESNEISSAGAAVPVMDIAQISVNVDGQEVSVGGLVLNMVWDPSGERLVVSFKDSNFMALFCTKVTSTRLSITPLGFIQGEPDEFSSTMEFAQKFSDGALLSIVWSSGRLQYFPMLFINPAKAEVDHLLPSSCLLSSSPGGAEFAPKIYSSPAL